MKRSSLSIRIAALMGLAILSASTTQADILYSSLPFVHGTNVAVSGGPSSGFHSYSESAYEFTPTLSEALDRVQLPLSYFGGPTDAVTVSVYSNAAGVPGSLLESGVISAGVVTGTDTLYTADFSDTTELTAGTPYFVSASTTGAAYYGWDFASGFPAGTIDVRTSPSGSFSPEYPYSLAVEVDGVIPSAATPEPGTFALLGGLAVVGAGILRRRRK